MARIRRARPVDAPAIAIAHASAIRGGCRTHYAPAAIAVWAAQIVPDRYADDFACRDVVVAEDAGRVVGFGVLDAADGEVRAVYVHPDVGRRGVGRALLAVLEATARLRGVEPVRLDAALNAEAFYLAAGWRRDGASVRTLAPGRDIACVAMSKTLAPSTLALRAETSADHDAIPTVHRAAFERDAEAVLVARLRAAATAAPSLVAALDGRVIGHVAFSPVAIAGARGPVVGLGPMAVVPELQGCGVGSRLVEEGLARCREAGAAAAVVLGHAAFYPRFGFVPASRFGLHLARPVPDDAFMAAELEPGALATANGVVRYRPEFEDL